MAKDVIVTKAMIADADRMSKGVKAIWGVLHGRWADNVTSDPDVAAAYKYAADLVAQLKPVACDLNKAFSD